MKKTCNVLFVLLTVVALVSCNKQPKETTNENAEATVDTIGVIDTEPVAVAPAMTDSTLPDGLYAKIETNNGKILLKLEMEKAPLTVANFVGLAEGKIANNFRKEGQPYFDGLMFHRVISLANGDDQDFMVQGGDPTGNGSGGPGYSFKDEIHPALKHDKPGTLSMANSGPATNGSQFFITVVPTPFLDGKHAVFGYVVDGQNVVNNMKQGETMRKVSILRRGEAAKNFDAKATFEKLK